MYGECQFDALFAEFDLAGRDSYRAGIFVPPTVVPEELAFPIHHPGQLCDVVGHGEEALIAFSQRIPLDHGFGGVPKIAHYNALGRDLIFVLVDAVRVAPHLDHQ